MKPIYKCAGAVAALLLAPAAGAALTTYEATGPDAASITVARDAFRTAVGGGTTAGLNGSFGGLRREINWDGVGNSFADPNLLPADFFNLNSPRGALFSTPGTGFLVSANAGQSAPTLFGFPNDFQTFSAQRLFTAVNSNITDVTFFLPGTATAATTSAFAAIFVDVEVAGLTTMEFFNESGSSIFSRAVLAGGNQGLSFLGAVADAGERISRVRLTSGLNTIVANGVLGNPNDDVVVMDDFLYAEPSRAVPEPAGLALAGLGLLGGLHWLRRRRPDA
ncbi:MAG TPA: PEP-CTERM sorting domain-containing protein [Candidatus Accumulibacter sp.]|nr:PEP-CTERM sorting domain-containing protein [Accumulibacter sp.]